MAGVNINGMILDQQEWSYSKLTCFQDCPYKFFLKYFCRDSSCKKFYASYGSFMHDIIEKYYSGELKSPEEMELEFLTYFSDAVIGIPPSEQIMTEYIEKGRNYLATFKPFEYNVVDIEKWVNFEFAGARFAGRIDFIGEDNGEYIIIDHKSRSLKPRSNRKKPTIKDKELDEMLKQLYIYSAAIKQEYEKFPKKLCFNCFNNGNFIAEDFDMDTYLETENWAKSIINKAKTASEFYPDIEFFKCRHICDMSEGCIYDQMMRGK